MDFALVAMDLGAERHLQDDDRFAIQLFLFREQEVGRIELVRVVGDSGDFLLEPGNGFRLDASNGSIVANAEHLQWIEGKLNLTVLAQFNIEFTISNQAGMGEIARTGNHESEINGFRLRKNKG